jgi:hypothetical protein
MRRNPSCQKNYRCPTPLAAFVDVGSEQMQVSDLVIPTPDSERRILLKPWPTI